ncbi:MAG TPA: LAGLIDADG family homing endonuclease [Pyrinomonadaceae bacterium]
MQEQDGNKFNISERLEDLRREREALRWEGSFRDYFELVTQNPRIAQLSHARINDMIHAGGVEKLNEGTRDELTRYNFFANELFGIEEPIARIVEYFKSAAQRLEVRKRILLLMGPVGGGKSTIVTMLKRGLEGWTRSDGGAVFAIKDCPMHEEPLHLIPHELRLEIEKHYGIYIEGDLCPQCRYALEHEYNGRHEDVKVHRVVFSEKNRIGIGTFSPSDPKCVTGDTLLLTNRGMLRFDELQREIGAARDEFAPFSIAISGLNGAEWTSQFYNGGVRPTRRIRTRLGYELEGSMVHPVLVLKEGCARWVKLSELKIGDHVALQRGQNLFGDETRLLPFNYDGPRSRGQNKSLTLPREMTPDLARLLGYVVAEGSLTDTALWVTNGDPRVVDDILNTCERLFDVRPKVYTKQGTHALSLSISSVKLVRWLEQVCGITRGAAHKRIPRVIATAPRQIFLSFLEGWFWGDGTLGARKSLRSNRFKVATASRELARQAQVALLNLGIVSALYQETIKDRFTAYSVVVTGDAVVDLLDLIPSLRDKCTDAPEHLAAKRGWTNFDIIPEMQTAVQYALHQVATTSGKALPGFHRYATDAAWGRNLTQARLRSLIEACERSLPHDSPVLAPLRARLDDKLLWLEVQEIAEGQAQVYDLTVPGTHSFCANGFINHNSQDVTELTGSIDLSTIGEVGVESDPRAYRFDGELNIANRGVMEFIEILKSDEKFLYNLLTLSQEQSIKTGRFAMIYADEVILSHTNENEYISFAGNRKSEALQDRIILVRVPYNLRVSQEERIYGKLLNQSEVLRNVHLAPNTLRVAAMFAVMTRLEEPKRQNVDIVKKMKLYDGEDVEGYKSKDVRELKDETVREGMDGISPRYIINRLSSALVRDGVTCINPIDALRAIKDGFEQHTGISSDQRDRYLNLISAARKEYDELAKIEVQRAFVYSFEEMARTMCNNYLDNVEAYCNKERIKDPITEEEMDPDEQLMRSIEEQIGITENAKNTFRQEILIRISSYARKGRSFEYNSHERLKEAIEKKIFADLKDVVKITTSAKTPDPDQLRRINEVVDRLVKEHGYCPVCANELLTYVGTLLSR